MGGIISVNISVSGMPESQGMITNLKNAVNDLSPEMQDLGEYFMEFFSGQVYDSEGGVFGHQWAPLSEIYAIQKAKRWGSGTILVASGEMQNSYSMQTSSRSMTISNSAPYFGFHQDGTEKMPQRILFDFDQPRVDYIVNTVLNGIMGRLGV